METSTKTEPTPWEKARKEIRDTWGRTLQLLTTLVANGGNPEAAVAALKTVAKEYESACQDQPMLPVAEAADIWRAIGDLQEKLKQVDAKHELGKLTKKA